MKKIVLICALLIGGVAVSIPPINAEAVPSTRRIENPLPEDATPITIYRIKQVGNNAWSNSAVSAYYSASENCIYVNEGRRKNQPYTVRENLAFGQENDGRAEYRYTAGGYYFNL